MKLRTFGDSVDVTASGEIWITRPVKDRSGYASRPIRTARPGFSAPMSAWFTFARTRIDAGFTTSTIGMPLRTSSPSCTSAMLFDFQIERRTAMPPIGDLIAMRSALLSAWRIAFSARSRRIWRMRRSASAAARFRS